MPMPRLPSIRPGKDQEQTIRFLTDSYNRLRKELEFLLRYLDDDNVLSLDASKIRNLTAEQIFTDVITAGTSINQVLYAKEGRIARLTVDHLLTGDFLAGDPYIYFIEAKDQYLKFIEGTRTETQVQYTTEPEGEEETGDPLYWDSASHNYMTPLETEWPVMVYVYDLTTKLQMDFESDISGTMVPKIIYGAGVGNPDHPNWGKGYDYKETDGLLRKYIKTDGSILSIKLGENGIEIDPPLLIFPDTFNDTQIIASAETVLPGIDAICNTRTRIAFDVQMDITASEAMTVTINARVDGVSHRHTMKYFSGAYKDGVCFNGILDVVVPGTHTVDITITPSVGSATIEATEYRLILTIRDGQATESTPWPEIKVTQPYSKITFGAMSVVSLAEISDALNATLQIDSGGVIAETYTPITIDDINIITWNFSDNVSLV